MKIKAPFRIERERRPPVEGKSGSYRPERIYHFIYALCGRLVQTCIHDVRE